MIAIFCILCPCLFASVIAKDEFTYQQYIRCSFSQQGSVGHIWKYGYNGKDIMHLNLSQKAIVADHKEGNFMAEERQRDKFYFRRKETRLSKICSAVQSVFLKSNNSLSRAAPPNVRVSLDVLDEQEYLVCSAHGFYPNIINMQWAYHGRLLHFGVTKTGMLPHHDGTFQMTIYLAPGNRTRQDITCEIDHITFEEILQVSLAKEFPSIGFLLANGLVSMMMAGGVPVVITVFIMKLRRGSTHSSVNESLDRSSDNNDFHASVSLMDIPPEQQGESLFVS